MTDLLVQLEHELREFFLTPEGQECIEELKDFNDTYYKPPIVTVTKADFDSSKFLVE